jgi:hypothetical protein
MNGFLQDLRYALRQLRKSPGFTAVAVLTLALGIAADTVIFSVMNATILKSLPFPEPDRLMLVWQTFGKGPDNWNIVSAPNYWDFAQQNHVFENMAIFDSAGRGYNLSAAGESHEPEQVSGLRVSATFFAVLGVRPGVVSYSVAQRTHERGVRIALGARPFDVLKLIVSGSMKWVLAGVGFGIVGSLGLMRLLGILLYEVKPTNPGVLSTAALLLTCVALCASYVPARRAARVEPMVALRYE